MMHSIADPAVLASLVARLRSLEPDQPRRWGTLSAGEMLCHLGDSHEAALGVRVPVGRVPVERHRPLLKWFGLRAPWRWPKGMPTRPGIDPHRQGTRPGEFEADRTRVIATLQRIAAADRAELGVAHVVFGLMTLDDWHRWAARHVDHHLRQFGA